VTRQSPGKRTDEISVGKRLAIDIWHCVDTAKEMTGLLLHAGGKERVAVLHPRPTEPVRAALIFGTHLKLDYSFPR
jgi:hypothetical protein